MKTKILIMSLAAAGSILFDSCLKKGEDDPALSFQSRKARVAGDWKVTSFKETYSSTSNGSTHSSVFTMNGSTYTLVETNSMLGTTTITGTASNEYSFEKDGSYKATFTYDGLSDTESGSWNFTSGVGDAKNKSQITTFWESYKSSDNSTGTQTGKYVDGVYDLKELRNKKMVWYKKTSSNDTHGYTESDEIEIVFEAK